MNELEKAIEAALQAEGNQKESNKAYLEFIKANLIIPIEKLLEPNAPPEVLFFEQSNLCFLPVFSNMDFFSRWALDIGSQIDLLKLSGVDLLKGIGEDVVVSLNIGSSLYKEFNIAELNRMKAMVLKIFS